MKCMMNVIVTLFTGLAFTQANADTSYRIDVKVDWKARTVVGKEETSYTNHSDTALEKIPLTFSDDVSVQAGKISSLDRGVLSFVPLHDRRGIEVDLQQALTPGGKTTFTVEFSLSRLPEQEGYWKLTGNWHPKMVTFRDGRWQPEEGEISSYDVALTVPEAQIIAASTVEQDVDQPGDGTKRLHFVVKHAKDFGIIGSPDFEVVEMVSEEVTIRSYFFPSGERWDKQLPQIAADVIAFYKQFFGFYPGAAL